MAAQPLAVQRGAIRPNTSQSRVLTGDFNGDGRTDLLTIPLQLAPVPITTWLSSGDGTFTVLPSFTHTPAYGTHPGTEQRFLAGDVDGDGRTDVIHVLAQQLYTWFARGDGTFRLGWKGGLTAQQHNLDAFTTGDVDGDGRVDAVYLPLSAASVHVYSPTGSGRPLLTEVETPLGGKTRFEYAPSSRWPQAQVAVPRLASAIGSIGEGRGAGHQPASAAFATVTAMITDDGRGGTSRTTYEYSGARYDALERELLGYRWVRETRPAVDGGAAPVRETWYAQGYGLRGLVEREDRFAGGLAASTLHELAIGAAVPYTQHAAGTWSYRYAPRPTGGFDPGAYRRTYVARLRDAHGNITDEFDHGDYDASGDEVVRFARFAPAAGPFLANRPYLVGVRQPDGRTLQLTWHVYDGASDAGLPPSRGELTAAWAWLDDGDGVHDAGDRLLATLHGYDARGNRLWSQDPTGARVTVTFDAAGRWPIATTDAAGLRATTEWDPVCGQPSAKVAPDGGRVTTQYDGFCRPSSTAGPVAGMGAEHGYAQLAAGPAAQYLIERVKDPSGAAPWVENRVYLDGLGRPWRRMRAAGTALATCADQSYDLRGNESGSTRPYACSGETPVWQRKEVDPFDRTKRARSPDGTSVTFEHGLDVVARLDEAGHKVEDVADGRGRVVAHREHHAGGVATVTTEYDRLDRPVRVVDPAGNQQLTEYDSLGRVVRKVDPDLGTQRMTYDDAGRLVETLDAKGQRLVTHYDGAGRPISRGALLSGSPSMVEESSISYDLAGRPAILLDPTGSTTLVYDLAGRVTRKTVVISGASYDFRFRHGAADQLLGVRYPDGELAGLDPDSGAGTALAYDALGRPRSLPGVATAITWDAQGRARRLDLANGAVTLDDYDALRGWLIRTRTSSTAGGSLLDLSYGYDPRGLPLTVRGTDVLDYQHDARRRLVEVSAAGPLYSYAYDDLGNLIAQNGVAYTYPAPGVARPHAVQRRGADLFTYDGNGNLLTGGGRTLTWDPFNRLRTVVNAAGTTEHRYDGAGQRRLRSSGGVTTHYPAPDYEVTAGVATRTVSLDGRVLAQRTGGGAGTWRWLHTDRLGSVRALTNAAGALVARRAYTPYGAPTQGAGASTVGFIGERHDDVTGLLYLNARTYDPALGRFLSPDVRTPDAGIAGLDRYGYAFGSPVALTDRNGRDPFDDYLKTLDPGSQEYQWLSGQRTFYDRMVAAGAGAEAQQAFFKWVTRGVQFHDGYGHYSQASLPQRPPPPQWAGSDIITALEGLDMVERTLTPGLAVHHLGLRGSETPSLIGGELGLFAAVAGQRAQLITDNNDLSLPVGLSTRDMVYALGRRIDVQAARRSGTGYADSTRWHDVAYYDANHQPLSNRGRPTSFAADPWTDFAETFTWFVFATNGQGGALIEHHGFSQPSGGRINYVKNKVMTAP
jgi:RHS repeat-associated protein